MTCPLAPEGRVVVSIAALLVASALGAQGATPAQEPEPPAGPPPSAVSPSEGDEASPERETLLPDLDFYFPEGELDFRLNRLIKGSFYEGQLRYNFAKGDIEAFVRYRYYGYRSIFQLGLFDTVEFEPIESGSNDFERTRGGLLLIERPFNYHSRGFFLAELDRITSNKDEFEFTTNKTDTFIRLGYQLGTADDPKLNAIVGETRAQRRTLFTAHRELGPYSAGLSGAVTWGFEGPLGDFDFIKLEFGALKRFRLGQSSYLVSRLHGGSFLRKRAVRPEIPIDSPDRYSVPLEEFFRLDGSSNLKGLQPSLRGTEELLTTLEFFVPWFVNDRRQSLGVAWESWYWLLYSGYGTIGFDREVLSDSSTYLVDLGVGFETSFLLKDYTIFISAIAAQTLDIEGGVEARVSVKAIH